MNLEPESAVEYWPSWATEPVRLSDPDPDWARRGEQERDHLDGLLAPWLTLRARRFHRDTRTAVLGGV